MDRITLHGQAQGYVENPTDADYAAAARWALKEKDLPLAVQQISAAISLSPLHEPHLRLLDEIVATTRGPLLLVKLPEGSVFFGLCAARARVLARLGRLDEALRHLFEATAFDPSTPFLCWARAWVGTAKSARSISPHVVAAGVMSLTGALRGRQELDEGAKANLEAALHVVERVRGQQPASAALRVAASRTLRLLERYEEALARLGDALAWEIAVERAAIHRERGEREAEVRALTQAVEARPGEATTHLDLGDAFLDDGRPEEAIIAYEKALALDACSDWARISAAYARSLAGGARELEVSGGSPVAYARARSLETDLMAYAERLGDPIDPIVAVIRSAGMRAPAAAADRRLVIRVRVGRPLAPSAHLAFSQALLLCVTPGCLVVEHDRSEVRAGPLWHPDAQGAMPAVDRPPDRVLDAVGELARMPFGWDTWRARAAELSARCAASDPGQIVHAMAYPPKVPPGADPVQWVHSVQVAAALMVALGSEAIETREHRLSALLEGVDDWSAAAAVLGLRALERKDPRLIERLHALVPAADEALPPLSRALAITGSDLTSGSMRQDFLRLRARVRMTLERASRRDAGP